MDISREGSELAKQAAEQAQELGSRVKSAGSAMWERAKTSYSAAQDKAAEGVQATDRVIRKNPYQSIGIAFGVGLLLGFFLKRKK